MTYMALLGSNSIVKEKNTAGSHTNGSLRRESAERKSMERNPIPFALLKDEETGRYENAHAVKRLDCSFYNECLDTAIAGKWKAFGCRECSAYVALDVEQKVQDVLGLLAARLAMENVIKTGVAGRTRGVKPGVDAKVRAHGNTKKKTG